MSVAMPRANLLDRMITWFDPEQGLRRQQLRGYLAMTGGYTGARLDRRQTSRWFTVDGSANRIALPDLPKLRERSRDLLRNAPLAVGAVNTVCTNTVGTGLKVQPRIDRELLAGVFAGDEAAFDRWERDAERVFREWSDNETCDATRTQTFAELQELAFRSVLESGDVFVVRRMLDRRSVALATALQLIEADQVANPPGRRDDRTLAAGVELDALGAPAAYHILDAHPGDILPGQSQSRRFAIYGGRSGERQILHLYRQLRPGQARGVPYLAPVIETFKQLDRYTEAEIMAAVVASMFTVFVKSQSGLGAASPVLETGARKTDEDYKLGSGAILDLAPDEDVTIANPGRPNDSFDPFILAVLRQTGVALELPFEVLVKHFTASYSAARAALLEAWKFFRARRHWLAVKLCQPVYGWVIGEAVLRGRLIAPGFFDDPALRLAYLGAEWTGPAAGQIDPLKENQADKIAEAHGWKTAQEITAEKTGGDWERKCAQRSKEVRMAAAGGMAPPGMEPVAPAAASPDPDRPEPN